jgi:hypothetical protein
MGTTNTTTVQMTGFAYFVAGLMIITAAAALAFGAWFLVRWYEIFSKLAV